MHGSTYGEALNGCAPCAAAAAMGATVEAAAEGDGDKNSRLIGWAVFLGMAALAAGFIYIGTRD